MEEEYVLIEQEPKNTESMKLSLTRKAKEMRNDFWKRKNIIYFVMSFFVVCTHNSGFSFFDINHIEISGMTRNIMTILGNSFEVDAAMCMFNFFSALLLFRPITENSGGGECASA